MYASYVRCHIHKLLLHFFSAFSNMILVDIVMLCSFFKILQQIIGAFHL